MSRINPDSDQVLKFMGDGYQIHKETEDISIQIASFQLDDINYFATYFRPLKYDKPKALVFICHGYGEYFSETYDEVCKELASNGILAFGHDHKGHGKTGGERVHVNSMDDYVRPMLLHIKKLSKDFNDELPIFALGHSMGGLITTYAGIEGQDLFKGLIFMGPLIKMDPNIATPIKRQLAHWLPMCQEGKFFVIFFLKINDLHFLEQNIVPFSSNLALKYFFVFIVCFFAKNSYILLLFCKK